MVEIITREFIQMAGTAGEVRPYFCPSFVMDFWKQIHSWVNFYSGERKLKWKLLLEVVFEALLTQDLYI